MSKLLLPAKVMDEMVCLICKKYLSVFPIYTKTDGSGGVCGRCPVPEPDQFVRDEAFENIAQFLTFPCAHKGCKEILTPANLKQHESCCIHRKYECPSKRYSKCDWTGALLGDSGGDLMTHFREKHQSLILSSSFELSFAKTLEENMLLCKCDDLFIVKKEVDARKGLFICSVEHLISKENARTYMYFLRCESEKKDYFYRSPEKPTKHNDSTKLTIGVLKERLHDPTSINVEIEIIESNNVPEKNVSGEASEEREKNPVVQWQMLSEFECPICLEYMLPPIFQCVRGHSICAECKTKVRDSSGDCPTCKQQFENTQNFALERMSQLMTYPCKFHKKGCAFASNSVQIRVHEDGCDYGPYECPLRESTDCGWKASSSEVLEHVSNNHDEYILKVPKMQVHSVGKDNYKEVKLIESYEKLFRATFMYQEQKFYWVMQLVGPASKTKKYKFEVDIIDKSGDKKRFFLVGCVAPLCHKDDILKTPGMYLVATLEQLEGFIREDFVFRIRIVTG